jgi:hypothetical protein
MLTIDIQGAASYAQRGLQLFDDQSSNEVGLQPSTVYLSRLTGNTIKICISTNGNDEWRFGYYLSGQRSDGGLYTFSETGIVLKGDDSTPCHSATLP